MMDSCGRILIVDDDAMCVGILCRLLRKEYELETASTGDTALAKLITFRPHLVLLDIMMPGLNGHETCRRIKFGPLSDLVQVILISGKDTILDRTRGNDIFADDRLTKPFDHEVLLEKVQEQFRIRDSHAALEKEGDCGNLVQQYCEADSSMNNTQQARFAAALRRLSNFMSENNQTS
jgi:putative two-component system response regulator